MTLPQSMVLGGVRFERRVLKLILFFVIQCHDWSDSRVSFGQGYLPPVGFFLVLLVLFADQNVAGFQIFQFCQPKHFQRNQIAARCQRAKRRF
jgi:hypothetical protein